MSKESSYGIKTFVKKAMNIALWICQSFLCILFGYSGIMKSSQRREYLVRIGQTGVANLSYPFIRFIGFIEILGAAAIILPQAIGIATVLTSVTAIGFAIIMLFAIPIHYKRNELKSVGLNLFVMLVSMFVAVCRFCANS